MSNATGERTFSTAGRTVKAKVFPTLPAGNYKGPLGSDSEIGNADKYDAVPYVKISFGANGTAMKEGGKDQRVFHMLFLSLVPGKDGEINTDRPDGITALAQAMGTEVEGVEIVEREVTNPETGETKKLEYLNPKQVQEWLKSFAGVEVSYRTKIEKGTGDYGDKSKIAKFLLAE
jgi:hypothetical protein